MLLVKQVGQDWVLCVEPGRQPWIRLDQQHVGGDTEGGVEGEGAGAGHDEPEGEEHFDLPPQQYGYHFDEPQHQYGPPPSYRFADASQYDHYTAYNNMMAAMSNLGSGIHQITNQMHSLNVNYQRTKRRMGASYRDLDQRITNPSDTVYGIRDNLTQFRQDFYAYRDQMYDPATARTRTRTRTRRRRTMTSDDDACIRFQDDQ